MSACILSSRTQRGFTLSELLIVFAILGIMAGIAAPNLAELTGGMKAQEEIQSLAAAVNQLRLEAMRMRTSIRVNFTSTGYSWDVGDDDTIDGSYTFGSNISWDSTPASILFNGLGLARGITGDRTIAIESHGESVSMIINKNGFVSL